MDGNSAQNVNNPNSSGSNDQSDPSTNNYDRLNSPESQQQATTSPPTTGEIDQVVTTPPPNSSIPAADHPKSKKSVLYLMLLLLFFLLLTIFSGYGLYAVAYEKVSLDNFPEEQEKISEFIIGLPFMPKTPEFLLDKTVKAHENVSSQSYDISVAVDQEGLMSLSNFTFSDFRFQGAVDYSNIYDPTFWLNINSNKLGLELRKPNGKIYFQVKEIPSQLLGLFAGSNIDYEQFLNQWVYYDLSPMQTEARDYLEQQGGKNPTTKIYQDLYDKYIDKAVLREIKIEQTTHQDEAVYKMYIDVTDEILDHIDTNLEEKRKKEYEERYDLEYTTPRYKRKLSEQFESLYIEFLIDQDDYLTKKITISSEVSSSYSGLGSFFGLGGGGISSGDTINYTVVGNFDDFGEPVQVDEPQNAISIDEFYMQIQEAYAPGSMARTRDSSRFSSLYQIKRAIEYYYTDNAEYPDNLQQLVPDELNSLPKDPLTEEDYYYSARTDGFDLCANLEDPSSRPSSIGDTQCPDANYNFHLDETSR